MSMNKTDCNDARSLAQLFRSGWFKAVHVKSVESQEHRTLLGSREFLVYKLRDHENEIRGQLRPFGLTVGQVSTSGFAERIHELVEGRPRLRLCMEALLLPIALGRDVGPGSAFASGRAQGVGVVALGPAHREQPDVPGHAGLVL